MASGNGHLPPNPLIIPTGVQVNQMEVQQKIVYSLVIPEMVNGMIYDAQIGLNLFASAGMHDFEYCYPNGFVVFCL
jgi:hypothetical protein